MAYVKHVITIVPIWGRRNINKFYQDSDFSQRNQYANMQRKAYIEMMDYINNSDIPTEEKEGILRKCRKYVIQITM